MSQTIFIPGANKLALETIAENAGVSIDIYLGQCIGLGLNLAELS
jgi:hypothetical protein